MISKYLVSNSYSEVTISKIIVYAILLNLIVLIINVFQIVENNKRSSQDNRMFSNTFSLEQQKDEINKLSNVDSLKIIALKYLKIAEKKSSDSSNLFLLDIGSLFQLSILILLISLFLLRKRIIANNS